MKALKSVLIVVFLFAGNVIIAQPPEGGRPPQGPPPVPNDDQIKEMVSHLSEVVLLSDEQQTKIMALYKAHFSAMDEKFSSEERPKREDMEALDADLQKKIKAELSEDQTANYETFLKTSQRKRPKRRD